MTPRLNVTMLSKMDLLLNNFDGANNDVLSVLKKDLDERNIGVGVGGEVTLLSNEWNTLKKYTNNN